MIPLNPVRGIKLKRQSRKRRKAFTLDEYAKLVVELDPHWHLLCDLITEIGVRWEEAMGLQQADVEGNVLWIGNVLNELTTPHRWEYLARTKTGKGRAVKTRPSLAEWISDRPDGFLLLRPSRAPEGRCRKPYCKDEAHVRGDYFRKQVSHPALEAIGLGRSGLAPHDLRRTHATWLRDNGVPLGVVQQRLGHGSLTTTQVYLGEVHDAEDVAVAAINW